MGRKVLLCRIDGKFGGVERHLISLARHLDPQRYTPVVVPLVNDDELARQARALDIQTIFLPMPSRLAVRSTARELLRIARQEEAVLIHTFGLRSNTLAGFARKELRIPWVIRLPNVSATDYENPLHGRLFFSLNNHWIRQADALQVISPQLLSLVQTWRKPPRRTFLIPNGVDVEAFAPERIADDVRPRYQIPPESSVIGSVGRLDRIKGFDRLIHALASLGHLPNPPYLLLVGSGAEQARLQQLARDLGIERQVIFAGYQADVRPFLKALDLFVCSSFSEGVPNAVLEAMAMGVPVISTRVGGIESIISHKEDGMLIPDNEVPVLAAAIEPMLRSPEESKRLAQAAQRKIQSDFSTARMVERIQAMYDELVVEHSKFTS